MKIVVAGGREQADYLTGLLKNGRKRLILINEDRSYCEYLSAKYDMEIQLGDPCLEAVLEESGIRGSDLLIALKPTDADNLEICQMAKRLFGVKKTMCLAANPANVDIFQNLGVDQVVSIPYILGSIIRGEDAD